ncbi:MAG: EAL domain-containing protein, partial [Hydrogenophaga sp.]|nr:EAL domain-containing protein [Hydrogenophaga sp.]
MFAREALVRGPNGESAASVLAQVNEANRYRFDQ